MSSLWTPGGEVPIDRGGQPSAGQPGAPGQDRTDHETRRPGSEAAGQSDPTGTPGREQAQDEQAQYEQLRRQMLDAPAADVIAQHAVALYELAALHLSEPDPKLTEARLAIDALTALVEGLSGRLGAAEAALTEALPQLKMAYVEATDRAAEGPSA